MLDYLFLLIFTCEALPHRAYSTQSSTLHIRESAVGICRENLPWLFPAKICRRNLPWEFAATICRENLPQEFAVGICSDYLPFVFVRKSFSGYVSKSCLYESKSFLYVSKAFLFVRFSLLTVSFLLLPWQLWAITKRTAIKFTILGFVFFVFVFYRFLFTDFHFDSDVWLLFNLVWLQLQNSSRKRQIISLARSINMCCLGSKYE